MSEPWVRRSSRSRRSVTLFDPEEEASKPQLGKTPEPKKKSSSSAKQRRRSKTPLKTSPSPRAARKTSPSPRAAKAAEAKPKRAYTKRESSSRRRKSSRPKKRKASPTRSSSSERKASSSVKPSASKEKPVAAAAPPRDTWSLKFRLEELSRAALSFAYLVVSVFAANGVLLCIESKHNNASLALAVVAFESVVSAFAVASGRRAQAQEILREFDRFGAGAMVALTHLSKSVAALYLLDVNFLPFLFCINCFLCTQFLPKETQGSVTFIGQITSGFLIVYSEWASQLKSRYMGTLGVLLVAFTEFGRESSSPRHEAFHLLFNFAVVFGASPENFQTGPVNLQRFVYERLLNLIM